MKNNIKKNILYIYRVIKFIFRILIGKDVWISTTKGLDTVWFGNPDYGGWKVPVIFKDQDIAIIDAGIGEDLSFSEDFINKYNAQVYAIDPTPRAKLFIENNKNIQINFYPAALSSYVGKAKFYMPTNKEHVSGALVSEEHLKGEIIEVDTLNLNSILHEMDDFNFLILKLDIEGAEFEIIKSDDFKEFSKKIDMICVEFHHRWSKYGKEYLINAIEILEKYNYSCVWANRETNEEFTFVKDKFFK